MKLEILVTTQFILIGILIYVIRNLLKQVEILEDVITSTFSRIRHTIHTMKVIDDRQIFEKDDEVGETFTQLYETLKSLERFLETE